MAQVITRRDAVDSGDAVVVSAASPAERIISGLTSLLEALLVLRFLLSLLGANPANGFANFIYSITYPFVAPFYGLFGYQLNLGVARFEFETVIAMVVWGIVGYGLARVMSGFGRRAV